MGFRNPITRAIDQVARDAANAAATAIIPGSRLAADAIDGKTITGAVVRTAAAGQRLQLDSTAGLVSYDAAGNVIATLSPGGKLTTFAGASSLVVDGGLAWKSGQTGSVDGSIRDDVLTLNGVPTGRRVTCSPGSIAGYAGTPATLLAQTTASGSAFQFTADTIDLAGAVTMPGDVGLTALPLSGTWVDSGGTFYKVHGGVCSVFVTARNTSGWAAGSQIGVLPVGARPPVGFTTTANVSGSATETSVAVLTSGVIQAGPAVAASNDIRFIATFTL